MKKIGFIISFIVLVSSVFGQQFLWSTVKDSTSKYLPLDNVTSEVLNFYDQYKYYYDLAGFSKDGFFEFVKKSEKNSIDWKQLKKKIENIEDLTVFAFRGNLGRGSVVFIMCISKDDVNMLLFSNTCEADAIITSNYNREKFANWFRTLNNNLVGLADNKLIDLAPKPDPGAAYHSGKGGGAGGGTGAGMGLGLGEGAGEGSGKGIGYGSGNRAYVNIPDVSIS
ncbi:MAG: hypothetical protein FWF65_08935, partial [Bacteroidetes bacterium]|nr:hypothetical protein [Bacteroidota bacterium]